MKTKIKLPELKNPINSNFSPESFTGHSVCLGLYVGAKIATFIGEAGV